MLLSILFIHLSFNYASYLFTKSSALTTLFIYILTEVVQSLSQKIRNLTKKGNKKTIQTSLQDGFTMNSFGGLKLAKLISLRLVELASFQENKESLNLETKSAS